MTKSQKPVPRSCHKCGVELTQDPVAIRIIAKLEATGRPGTCANCAVDGGKQESKASE